MADNRDPGDRALFDRCERILACAARLVPADARADWSAEWTAELFYRAERLAGATANRAARRHLVAHAFGAIPHALSLRLQQLRFNVQDVTFAFRTLVRQPVFVLTIIGTLALGIGANTAMFTVLNAVLLRPLPYPDADRLVWAFGSFPMNNAAAVSPPDFVDYRERSHVFAAIGAMTIGEHSAAVVVNGRPDRVPAAIITDDLLPALGVEPALGRGFNAADTHAGAPRTVVVSHHLWCDRLGCDPRVIGGMLDVDAQSATIVGVMPEGFRLPFDARLGRTGDVDVWLPLRLGEPGTMVRRFHSLAVIARLKTGIELSTAQADVDVVARQLAAAYPEDATWTLRIVPLRDQMVANVRTSLIILQAVVALVLLVACGNVASLMLARGSTRSREMAVRLAIGASRARVVRQLLTESLILATAAAALALLFARWSVDAMRTSIPALVPGTADIRIDPAVTLFTVALVVVTSVACGLVPALRGARTDMTTSIKSGGRSTDDRSPRRLRDALVVAQVAASAVLLVAAGLLLRSLWRLQTVPPGFDRAHLATTQVWLPEEHYRSDLSRRHAYDAMLDQLMATAGVERAAMTSVLPMTGANDTMVYPEGEPPQRPADRRYAQIRIVSPGYFETMRIPILAGRDFTPHDGGTQVVINQSMARQFLGGGNALGRRLIVDLRDRVTAEVVGVVGDVREFGPAEDAPPVFYFSSAFLTPSVMAVVVRSPLDEAAVATAVRTAIAAVDSTLPSGRAETMDAVVGRMVAEPRFRTALLCAFATVALLLTVVGLYGTLAYLVAIRSREISIHLALGAGPSKIVAMVFRRGATLVATGVVIGVVAALWATHLLRGLLYDVRPDDPVVFTAVVASLATCGAAAALLPAWRAARVDAFAALQRDA